MTKTLKLAAFLDAPNGRTLQEAADHFGVAKRTVQRWLDRIEADYQGLKVEHLWDVALQKRFRCASSSKLCTAKVQKRDILAIWSMSLAASVMRSAGLSDDADAILAMQAQVLKDVPRAQRLEIEKRIAVLASGEKVPSEQSGVCATKGVSSKLRLAILHDRRVTLSLIDQVKVSGRIKAILHEPKILVVLETAQGGLTLALGQIREVTGVDDLFQVDYLNAA